jgi:Ca2+:H+ antiporter
MPNRRDPPPPPATQSAIVNPGSQPRTFERADWILVAGSTVLIAGAGVTRFTAAGPIPAFLTSGFAVALLAALVGRSVEQLGDRFGAGATGALQSALGNLPELFISLFALQSGLVVVVQAALIGSILANLLLVLGLGFVVGGLRHGTQRVDSQRARRTTVLMLLAVAAMVIPSLASYVHTPAAPHEDALSLAVSVILLILFVMTLPASLKRKPAGDAAEQADPPRWPLALALLLLAGSAIAAAFVSEWFVHALEPAMRALRISDAFAGLVIVAIAGNAVENVVSVQLAARNRSEYAFSVVINSPLQIALVLAPALVILSRLFGFAPLTLVFPPMLVVAVAIAVLVTAFITWDGESDWGEGVALIALYAIAASAFWWG